MLNDERAHGRPTFAFVLLSTILLFLLPLSSTIAVGPKPPSAGVIEIPAFAFDRGNPKTFTRQWVDGRPMVAFGGRSPVVVEYDFDLPVDGSYTIEFCYAAASARPVQLYLDERGLGDCCRTTTGSWNTSSARWEVGTRLFISPGKHTLRLARPGSFPHLVALRLTGSRPFPKDWKLSRPGARKLDDRQPVGRGVGYDPDVVDAAALRRAIEDLQATFPRRYANGKSYLRRLDALVADSSRSTESGTEIDQETNTRNAQLIALRNEALLANPLLDFDQLLLVKRGDRSPALGLPRNWQSNCSLPTKGFDDEVVALAPVGPKGRFSRVYKPERDVFVGDIDLHYDAQRALFSSVGPKGRWQVFEMSIDGKEVRQLTGRQVDVDSYDACYLPNDQVLFTSTACFVGVPCVYGSSHVATIYRMDGDGENIRQLCFDQEHNWCPTVLNDGRVLYARWEYSGTPHSNTRLLFQMNPDGTEQRQYYGGSSYWPNSIFYARPIPDDPSKVIGVIGGHHDNPRMGELVLFDPSLGRREADGAVQRIPGYGKRVPMVIADGLTRQSWPKFLHPYPLNDKYFLVACRPNPGSSWGIYLVDVFDNFVRIKEEPGYALFEPIPLRKTNRPPVVRDRVDTDRKDAVVIIHDIYQGDGLKGIPRGTVKQLRIFSYHFAYQDMGGLLGIVGMDGPWDIKRVLGTVPMNEDGSVGFRIPANVPISIQPLDAEGKAIQLMRSWMTAMPGEVVQCAGCHESSSRAPDARQSLAAQRPPSDITPWHGPWRGFSYAREVQPVIDRYCVSCHDGQTTDQKSALPDLRGDVMIGDWKQVTPGNGGNRGGRFSVGYYELSRFVRRPGIESDLHVLEPMEFHADTTQLVQLLEKGHGGVELDAESWDRIITWIDLNCPYHGTWLEATKDPGKQRQRRRELLLEYGGYDDDPEAILANVSTDDTRGPARSEATRQTSSPRDDTGQLAQNRWEFVDDESWRLDDQQARQRQEVAAKNTSNGKPVRTLPLNDDIRLSLTLVPAGHFVTGSGSGVPVEHERRVVEVPQAFWMGQFEITNEQYALFDAQHDSRVETKNAYQFGIHGYPTNRPEQPVVRISWQEAMAFCRWLSKTTGESFSLPSEAQWEYGCRAGAATSMSYGDASSDFSKYANLADATMRQFASDPYTVNQPLANPTRYDDWIPRDNRFNDGSLLSIRPGSYEPNAWGLYDMHGNVSEWTRSPGAAGNNHRGNPQLDRVIARGGSWRDRPARATASYRVSYAPFQKVYNVGFRVVCETDQERLVD